MFKPCGKLVYKRKYTVVNKPIVMPVSLIRVVWVTEWRTNTRGVKKVWLLRLLVG